MRIACEDGRSAIHFGVSAFKRSGAGRSQFAGVFGTDCNRQHGVVMEHGMCITLMYWMIDRHSGRRASPATFRMSWATC